MIYIYVLVDPITNEIRYCGKTHNIKERYIGHLKEKKYKNKKYYWLKELKSKNQKPIMDVIDEVLDEEWDFWEKYWICQLKAWGFNLLNQTNGGEFSVTGFKHSKESKLKIINAQKGRKLNEEWKDNISKARKGIKFSDVHLKNLSLSHKGIINKSIQKSIYQISMIDGIIINKFESISEALSYLKQDIKNGSITMVCKGKLKSTFGYYWCYEKDYKNYKFQKFKLSTQRIINQYDKKGNLINIFDSIYEASKKTGLNRNSISHSANDINGISHGGFIWIFKGDENKLKYKIDRCIKNYIVLQIKNDVIINIYNNIKDATEKTGIKHIGCVIRGDRKIAGGFQWKKQLI